MVTGLVIWLVVCYKFTGLVLWLLAWLYGYWLGYRVIGLVIRLLVWLYGYWMVILLLVWL